MPKIKLTKNELKAQRDALKRFQRYLPTLQLKKQQLQLEARRTRDQLQRLDAEMTAFQAEVGTWVQLVDDSCVGELDKLVQVEQWRVGIQNIAGIDTPSFEALRFAEIRYDLFTTPLWFDDAVAAVRKLTELRLRRQVMAEQLALIEQELRIVTQRVNLFEKVKIPEARESIRRIRIYLGDQQANAVGRAKIAKAKCHARDTAMQLSA